jgi:DNA repair protein RecO (recombination protein O)
MFICYRTEGLIIKKEDRGESDRLFTLFTKDFGKLELLAKSERKISSKLRSGLELFYLSEVEFIQGRRQKTLTDSILINKFKNLRNYSDRLRVSYAMCELLDKLVRGQEAEEKIWALLKDVFNKLNEKSAKIQNWSLIYYYFIWNLSSFLGYGLELNSCISCRKDLKPEAVFFDLKRGGTICGSCRKSIEKSGRISPDSIKVLRVFLKGDLKTLERLRVKKKELNEIASASRHYLSAVLEKTQ